MVHEKEDSFKEWDMFYKMLLQKARNTHLIVVVLGEVL